MTLSDSQQQAFNKIIDFIDDRYCPIFILKGYAGTGKTTLIKIIADHLLQNSRHVVLAAPTGRAARVLTSKTGLESKTVHSLIYSTTEDDLIHESDDLFLFNFTTRRNKDAHDAVYIIDEASMVSNIKTGKEELNFGSGKLLEDLLEYAGIINTLKWDKMNRKIIFVGDPAQLPPVGSEFSFALSPEYLQENFDLESESYTMTEVFRQASESGILLNATQLREQIAAEQFTGFELELRNGVSSLAEDAHLGEEFLTHSVMNNDSIIIAYTNKQVAKYNSYIRSKVYGKSAASLNDGERLLVVENNYAYGLLNGDIVTLLDMAPGAERVNVQVYEGCNVELVFRDVEVQALDMRGKPFNVYCKMLENLLDSPNRSLSRDEATALRIYARKQLGVKPPLKKLKKSNPEEYRKKLVKYFLAMRESPYFNVLLVKYGYAVTCHKAQGGEWENVFLDLGGFFDYHSMNFYRWAYTAITRASRSLYLLNSPRS